MKPRKGQCIPAKVNLQNLIAEFGTEEACRAELETLRWPKGVICPRCQSKNVGRLPTRPVYYCRGCKYQFSVTAGTIFNDSHLKLSIWFYATFLLVEAKKSMSSRQLERTLGVSHKTAWYLTHRIRAAMQEVNPQPLSGTIEVDETYVGGKTHGRGRGKGAYLVNKALVLAAIQRGGDIRVSAGKTADRKTLHSFIRSVAPNPQRIMTDQYQAYLGISDEDTTHETVNHGRGEYVRGDVHTNSVESAFGLFKRAVIGSFHQISHKHLPAYLQEFEFRFNNRKNPYLFRDTLIKLLEASVLRYQELTA